MDFNEEDVLMSLRNMEDSNSESDIDSDSDDDNKLNGNGVTENGHAIIRHHSYPPTNNLKVSLSLPWFDLRVFYVRVTKCVINNDSTPEFLTLNHVPLNRDTLLEANGVRTSIYSDGVSITLKRDRLDKKSEEVTFVSTDSVRMTGSVKFEVYHRDVMVLFGTLESSCHSNNGFIGESKHQGHIWNMSCESDIMAADGFFKGNSLELGGGSPSIEVYVAGCFAGSPIILTKTLQLNNTKRKQRKGKLESIPEYESTHSRIDDSANLTTQMRDYQDYRQQEENPYTGMEYLEGEDGELSWFNAGVRVGVGIGLSVCLGVGIGVGLLVRTYQGTTRNFTRHLL